MFTLIVMVAVFIFLLVWAYRKYHAEDTPAEISETLNHLIGKEKSSVETILQLRGLNYRVIREDDNSYIVSQDLMPTRINLSFDRGLLTEFSMG